MLRPNDSDQAFLRSVQPIRIFAVHPRCPAHSRVIPSYYTVKCAPKQIQLNIYLEAVEHVIDLRMHVLFQYRIHT